MSAICRGCGLPISADHHPRHFGFYVKHHEAECVRFLKAEIERLTLVELDAAQLKGALAATLQNNSELKEIIRADLISKEATRLRSALIGLRDAVDSHTGGRVSLPARLLCALDVADAALAASLI